MNPLVTKRQQIGHLFRSELRVINLGLTGFRQALDDAHVQTVQVDWKPSVDVDPKLRERVRASHAAIEQANARVMKIILGGMPHLVGLERAIDVIPGHEAGPAAARRAAHHLGSDVRADARRDHRRAALRAKGRDARGSRAARRVRRDQVRSLPRARAVGPMAGHRLAFDAGVRAEERGVWQPRLLHDERRARQGPALRRLSASR